MLFGCSRMPMAWIRHQRRGLAASVLRVPRRMVCTRVLARNYGKFLAPLNAKKARGLDILNDPLWCACRHPLTLLMRSAVPFTFGRVGG